MTGLPPVSARIWDMKYRLRDGDGAPIDRRIEDSWRRVARALAAVEAEPARWEEPFYRALEGFRFLPAGRILAGAGTARKVTLFNCFVMGRIADDMTAIFEHLKEAALTMQQGGGIGYDFSTLRPKGAPVRGVGSDASGPLPFMDVWDAMCRTIMSAGFRRGAMMGCMRCDHPDIEAFIEAKREAGRLRMFNLSVLVTDAFMEAVKDDGPWELLFDSTVYRTVSARELWEKIVRSTYAYAEPGVIFIDRINRANNLAYCEEIFATNPCGEQPLPPYGACLLGSINLASLVTDPFEESAALDSEALAELAGIAVRMLDNAIDCSGFPIEAQRAEARAKRRIGLGITGLADALILCRARYGGERAMELIDGWMGTLRRAAYLASVRLAEEKGAFPLYEAEPYLAGETVGGLDDDIRAAIRASGIRNALLTSVAPTGTISLLAGNVSSGIEPVFSYSYTRTMLMPDGSRRAETVEDYAHSLFRRLKGDSAPLPDYFVDAGALRPRDHLAVQARVQAYVDSSISKTVNCPESMDFEAFKEVYREAFELGCKGCTTYRPNPVTGAVLERGGAAEAAASEQTELPLEPPPATPEDSLRSRRRGLHDQTAGTARSPAGADLQDPLAGARPRLLHHHQRRGAGWAAAAVRDFHQFEEHRAPCLDGRADPHDQCRVPPGRRRVVRGGGAQGGVRSAGRPVDGGPLHAFDPGGDRRRDRAASGGYRLSAQGGEGPRGRAGGRPARGWRRASGRARALYALRPAGAPAPRGLRHVPLLRLLEMRVSRQDAPVAPCRAAVRYGRGRVTEHRTAAESTYAHRSPSPSLSPVGSGSPPAGTRRTGLSPPARSRIGSRSGWRSSARGASW